MFWMCFGVKKYGRQKICLYFSVKNSFATIEENKHWMNEYADWTLYFDMICAAAVLFQVIHDWAAKSITPNIPGKLHSDWSFGVNIERVFFQYGTVAV